MDFFFRNCICLLGWVLMFAFSSCDNEPYEGDFPESNADSCQMAIEDTATAALNFSVSNIDTYGRLCVAYKSALQVQIAICGDADGVLQIIVDSLGNCTEDTSQTDCQLATTAVVFAESAFNNSTNETYTPLCNAYKMALEQLILQCGDVDGSIQGKIDALGNCILDALEVEININIGSISLQFDMVTVVDNAGVLEISGEISAEDNYKVYFEIGQGQSGVNIINESFVLIFNETYGAFSEGTTPFYSEITANTSEGMVGAFSGNIVNDSGDILFIDTAVIDIVF